jgi:hypothetical protein
MEEKITLNYLIKKSAKEWHDAQVCVVDPDMTAFKAIRFSLHENISGNKFIIIHKKELNPNYATHDPIRSERLQRTAFKATNRK